MKKEIAFLLLCIGILVLLMVRTLREGRWMSSASRISHKEEAALFAKPILADAITRIEIRRPHDILVFSRQKDGQWRMVNPIEAQPDASKIDAILNLLLTKDDTQKLRIPIGKDPAVQTSALETFGMGKPQIGIFYQGNFGEQSLWLGEKAPQEEGVYGRWTQERHIELVSCSMADMLQSAVEDFREHRILHDPGALIVAAQFRNKYQSLQLLEDGRAILNSKDVGEGADEITRRADPVKRKEVFEFLEGLRCADFVEAKQQVLSRESLMTMELTRRALTLPSPRGRGEEGRERRETIFGKETWILQKVSTVAGEQWVFSGPPQRGQFIVNPESFSAYLGDSSWILDHTILDVSPKEVNAIALNHPNSQIEFVRKDTTTLPIQWRLVKPRAGEADGKALQAAMEKLLPLRATRLLNPKEVREIGKFSSRLEIKISAGGKEHSLLIGQALKDGIWAYLAGEPYHFLIAADALRAFQEDPIAYVRALEEDSNRNGKVDQRIHYQKGIRIWMESDDDEDGKTDTKTFWRYNRMGGLVRVDTDTDNNGSIDQRMYLAHGVPYRQEDDASGSGRVDVWTSFVKGIQARQRLDSDGDGRPDLFKKLQRSPAGDLVGAQVHQRAPTVSDYIERYDGDKVLREMLPQSTAK